MKKITILISIFLLIFIALNLSDFDNEPLPLSTQTESGITIRVPATHVMTPTTTAPQAPDGPDSHWFYSEPVTLERDTNITGFTISMDGADTSVLHHVSIGVLNRTAPICPWHYFVDKGAHELYSASRVSLDPIEFPAPYGMPVKKGETIFVEFMAHPQTHEEARDITPTLVIELATDDQREEPITFTRLRLDDSPCAPPIAHQAFGVPTSTNGAVFIKDSQGNEESSSVFFTSSTTIVLGGANFWPRKGGQDVTVFLNGDPIKQFTADKTNTKAEWNIPLSADPIAVPASSTIEIESSYINPFDTPVLDASGMYGFFHTTQE